jgi:hypothetical protein
MAEPPLNTATDSLQVAGEWYQADHPSEYGWSSLRERKGPVNVPPDGVSGRHGMSKPSSAQVTNGKIAVNGLIITFKVRTLFIWFGVCNNSFKLATNWSLKMVFPVNVSKRDKTWGNDSS